MDRERVAEAFGMLTPTERAALWAALKIVSDNPDYAPVDDMVDEVYETARELSELVEEPTYDSGLWK
jgi:hypothetical protein